MQAECRSWCAREGLSYELNIGPSDRTEDHEDLIAQVRHHVTGIISSEIYKRHEQFLSDATVLRFLRARKMVVKDAGEMLVGCLQWRERRSINDLRAAMFEHECATGKIFRPGLDRWGRPFMCFNNHVQNTDDSEAHMTFLAWSMEECERSTGTNGAAKYSLFVNLEEFSLFNNPPFSETKETLWMVQNGYPERMGSAVVYQAPWIFKQVWNWVKVIMDERTHSKLTFVVGDVSPGSKNDRKMCSLIGNNWKQMTGVHAGLSTKGADGHDVAPDYDHAAHWPMVLAQEKGHGLPKSRLPEGSEGLAEAVRLNIAASS